jgi:RNA polymerase sigma-70 factor (ECF subfamily)
MPPDEQPEREEGGRVLKAEELAAERRLIEASQKDPSRFAGLYERYFYRVYAFALARTGEQTMAEDVTSETFRRAFQHLPGFQWRGVPFSSWLFRIAANAAIDMQAKGGRQVPLDEVAEQSADPTNEMALIEERVQLLELVERLPRDQRRVIVLRFSEGRRAREIAEAMGRSEGAVKQLQLRALQNLRTWIGESYE